jgi:hypothetical protein
MLSREATNTNFTSCWVDPTRGSCHYIAENLTVGIKQKSLTYLEYAKKNNKYGRTRKKHIKQNQKDNQSYLPYQFLSIKKKIPTY